MLTHQQLSKFHFLNILLLVPTIEDNIFSLLYSFMNNKAQSIWRVERSVENDCSQSISFMWSNTWNDWLQKANETFLFHFELAFNDSVLSASLTNSVEQYHSSHCTIYLFQSGKILLGYWWYCSNLIDLIHSVWIFKKTLLMCLFFPWKLKV